MKNETGDDRKAIPICVWNVVVDRPSILSRALVWSRAGDVDGGVDDSAVIGDLGEDRIVPLVRLLPDIIGKDRVFESVQVSLLQSLAVDADVCALIDAVGRVAAVMDVV